MKNCFYFLLIYFLRLSDVTLDIASSIYTLNAEIALAVEQCQCPPNYEGLSCEKCADGYYRAQTGPYGGFCIPCQCNGHASTCDKVTGVCIVGIFHFYCWSFCLVYF